MAARDEANDLTDDLAGDFAARVSGIERRLQGMEEALRVALTAISDVEPKALPSIINGFQSYETAAQAQNGHAEQIAVFRRLREWLEGFRDMRDRYPRE